MRVEWEVGRDKGTWLLGGEETRAGPGGKIMVKLPGGNNLTPMLPWLWDSMQGSWPL